MPGTELLISLIAGLITAALGATTGMLARRARRDADQQLEQADDIARAAIAKTEESRARTLEVLIQKLPDDADPRTVYEDLSKALSKVAIGERLPATEAEDADAWKAVEGLVTSYHKQALEQAKIQFWFSVVAATVGFGLIIYAVVSAQQASEFQMILKALPGVVIDAVAALFFKQASETRQRATALYDRLRSDSEKDKALQLIDSIEHPDVRAAVQAQLALHMGGFDAKAIDLQVLFASNGTPNVVSKPPETPADVS